MSDNHSGDFYKGLLIGGAIGAIIALLYAPKSGKETREELAKKGDEVLDKIKKEYEQTIQETQKQVEQLSKTAHKKADQVSDHVSQIVEKGKETVEVQKGRLKDAIGAAKDAYHEEKATKKKKA